MNNFETALAGILATVGVSILGIVIARLWIKTKSVDSVFAQDRDLDDIAMSLISSFGETDAKVNAQGRVELRPTIGIRFLAPLVILPFLMFTDWQYVMPVHEGDDAWKNQAMVWGIWLVYAACCYNLMIVQRVTFDKETIDCRGVDFSKQERNLYDLVDISLHPNRPALVLSFSRQKPLYIPKFISEREAFLRHMREICEINLGRGARPRKKTLRDRFGI